MTIIARYVVGQYLKVFGLCMAAAAGLFLIIEFFDKIGGFSRYDPRAADVAAYFIFKLPSILTDVYPAAALIAVMISLGTMARNREILALRACGVGTWQLALPLVAVAGLMSVAVLVWNETVVPTASAKAHTTKDIAIKKKAYRGSFNASAIWFQNKQGFVNIDYFDANRSALYGMTIYETGPSFKLNRIIEVPEALWRNQRWEIGEGTVKNIGPTGEVIVRRLEAGELDIKETPTDFASRRRRASEYSYRELSRQIKTLESKGLTTIDLRVDLNRKLAWPFCGMVTVLMAFPLAVRGGRRIGVSGNIGVGMFLCFAFWVTMAVALSAGRSGALSPAAAAWTANGLFTALGGLLYTNRNF
ncbi:MAG: LPS export ABC transporter permease LptG [Deltaproteobacteria bacterium]